MLQLPALPSLLKGAVLRRMELSPFIMHANISSKIYSMTTVSSRFLTTITLVVISQRQAVLFSPRTSYSDSDLNKCEESWYIVFP